MISFLKSYENLELEGVLRIFSLAPNLSQNYLKINLMTKGYAIYLDSDILVIMTKLFPRKPVVVMAILLGRNLFLKSDLNFF